MNTLAKCKCQHCDQKIEFDSDSAGTTVNCPSCGMETLLFIPQAGPLPELPTKSSKSGIPKIPTWAGAVVLVVIVIVSLIVWARLTDTSQGEGPGVSSMIVTGVIFMCAFVIGMLIYFAPSLVAHKNKKRNFQAIFVLNFLTGWTFIGWVIAMVWACTVDS